MKKTVSNVNRQIVGELLEAKQSIIPIILSMIITGVIAFLIGFNVTLAGKIKKQNLKIERIERTHAFIKQRFGFAPDEDLDESFLNQDTKLKQDVKK